MEQKRNWKKWWKAAVLTSLAGIPKEDMEV